MATKPNDNVRPLILNRTARIEAVKLLRQYDHAFLSAEGVDKITAPFGIQGWSYPHKANPEHPKGLTFNDGSKVKTGMAAHEIAARLCRHLNVEYVDAFGRGTQLRNCCDALEEYLSGKVVSE